MVYWKYFEELENWEQICADINAYSIRTNYQNSTFFWNTIPISQLQSAAPQLAPALLKHGVFITYAALIVSHNKVPDSYGQNIHVDDMPGVQARLQLPIRNTAGSFTHFYSVRSPDRIQKKMLPNGHYFHWVDPIDAVHETEVCVDRPTFIRTGQPHSVQCNLNGPLPRITCTLRLSVDPGKKWLAE